MSKSVKNGNDSNDHRSYIKPKFEDRYHRMTIYVERNLFEQIQYQREQGVITNLTDFINRALTRYLQG